MDHLTPEQAGPLMEKSHGYVDDAFAAVDAAGIEGDKRAAAAITMLSTALGSAIARVALDAPDPSAALVQLIEGAGFTVLPRAAARYFAFEGQRRAKAQAEAEAGEPETVQC